MPNPGKPTADLKLHGGFRPARHAERLDNGAAPSGKPVEPGDLSSASGELWQQIVAEFGERGILGQIDTAALTALCEVWGLYRQCAELAKASPTDKEIRCAVVAYLGMFDRLASQFGLSPAMRTKIKAPQQATKGVTGFARKRS